MTRSGAAVDWPALRAYLREVAAAGPVALAVTADTAEVGWLSHEEQLRVVEVATEVTGLACIAGLTADDELRAVARAKDLSKAGAAGLLVFPRPDRHDEVVEYHRAIGDVGLPLIAFQLQPSLGGVVYRPEVLRRLLRLEAVVALKEASFDRRRFQEAAVVADAEGVAFLTGNDNFLLESFRLGAQGALLGFGAILTRELVGMVEAWKGGRVGDAEAWSGRLQPLADAVFAPPVGRYRARLKECLVMLGVLPSARGRALREGLDETERARLRAALDRAVSDRQTAVAP